MSSLEDSLIKISKFLEASEIPYIVIGGMANLYWGVSRATLDVDLTIKVDPDQIASFSEKIKKVFRIRVADPAAFAAKTHVLPVEDTNGVRIDLILAKLPYEIQALQRAIPMPVAGGVLIKVCSPEDLIIHKIISDRLQDQEDVKGIIRVRGPKLDRKYLDPIVKQLTEALTKPGIWKLYLQLFESKRQN